MHQKRYKQKDNGEEIGQTKIEGEEQQQKQGGCKWENGEGVKGYWEGFGMGEQGRYLNIFFIYRKKIYYYYYYLDNITRLM